VGVVAVIGAKGAPGATTAAVALALCWPRPVLLADADPAGGDIAAAGFRRCRVGRGLLSFAAATRHAPRATAAELAAHVAAVPDAPGVLLLLAWPMPGRPVRWMSGCGRGWWTLRPGVAAGRPRRSHGAGGRGG